MSKLCRLFFVKMVQVQNKSRRTRLHHNLSHATNAPLIIEGSNHVIKQSEDWLMTTSDPNSYLRNVINLVNSLRLLCPLYSFILLLPTSLSNNRANTDHVHDKNVHSTRAYLVGTRTRAASVSRGKISKKLFIEGNITKLKLPN